MIQPQRLTGKASNIARYYTVGDYYTKGGDEPSQWGGKIAADLGLSGPVDPKVFRELLAGKVGEQQLGRVRRDGEVLHHPGWDFAVNAPKSVSIMALVAGDERVLAAHERAVSSAIDYLEEHAQLRRRGGGGIHHETTERILVARFTEHGSRDLDPHLHTHLVVLNMTNREDGERMASLETRAMYAEQRAAGQIYRNALAFSLREAGYEIEFDPRSGLFELKGVPRELISLFSQRTHDIEEHAREHGLVGQKAKRASFYATRKAKEKVGHDDLIERWCERSGQNLNHLRELTASSREHEGRHLDPDSRAAARGALFGIRQKETGEGVNNLGEILRAGLAAHVGEIRLEDIRPHIDRHEELRKLLATDRQTGDAVHTRGRTTLRTVRLELGLTQEIALGLGDARPIASSDRLLATLERANLTPAQERALVETTTSRDRITAIHGVAGAGKSTLIKALADAAEPGTNIVALAPTSSAAAGLGKVAGIESRTVASLIAGGGHGMTDRHVLVVDEAGQLGNRQARRLLEISRLTGARLLLVGDEKQTGAIEQGKPFWLMRKLGLPTAELIESMRQETKAIKSAVAFARTGNYARSLCALDSVVSGPDNEQLAGQIVDAWTRLKPAARADTNILVLDNASRHIVNSKIREVLRTENALAAEDTRLSILSPASFTDQEKHMARFYSGGQVVRFGSDVAGAGIARDTEYRVIGIGREANGRQIVRLIDEHGRVIRWDPQTTQARRINVFNREERDLAEGDRIQWRLVNRDLDLRNAERGTVEKLDGTLATIRWDRDGRAQQIDLLRNRTWDHGYAETVYSAQSKTYPRVYVLAPAESPLVNGQNYYTAITRARFGAKLWTNDAKRLVEKLEQRSGEKTSALEGLGRIRRDGAKSFADRHADRLATLRHDQHEVRAARRQATLERELKLYNRRERPPSGLAEHAAQGARDLVSGLDRFLTGILNRARESETDKPIAVHQPMPARDVAEQSHDGPER